MNIKMYKPSGYKELALIIKMYYYIFGSSRVSVNRACSHLVGTGAVAEYPTPTA